jgi:hypothetical protein
MFLWTATPRRQRWGGAGEGLMRGPGQHPGFSQLCSVGTVAVHDPLIRKDKAAMLVLPDNVNCLDNPENNASRCHTVRRSPVGAISLPL